MNAGAGAGDAAVLLAGGRAARLGGVSKPGLVIDGRALLDTVQAAVRRADPIVVVGTQELARPGLRVVREDPPFGGPAAAIVAGVAALAPGSPEWVWLLACDLPRAPELVAMIESAVAAKPLRDDEDAVIAVDTGGHDQWLAGRYRRSALELAIAALSDERNAAVRQIVGSLRLRRIMDENGAAADLDTWDDVERYRAATSSAQRSAPTTERGRSVRSGRHRNPSEEETPMSDANTPAELDEWLTALAAELGVDVTGMPVGALLDLARDVAHNVVRPAAPLSAFVVGLAAADGGPDAVRAAAEKASAFALRWPETRSGADASAAPGADA